MYRFLKIYGGDMDVLLAQIPRLSPQRGGTGYVCTNREGTREIYRPLLKEIFPGTWTAAFLAIIWPNGSVMPHFGEGELIAEGSTRYHLVMKTNEYSWSMHDNRWQQLEERGVYEMDPRLIHASINWGKEWRVHLAIDIDGGLEGNN